MTDMDEFDCEDAGAHRRVENVRADIDAWFIHEVLALEAVVTQYLRRNWRGRVDVADLLQDVYLRVYEAAGKEPLKFTKSKSTRAFVFAIAHNLLVDHLRREKIVPIESVDDLDALGAAAEMPGPEAQVIARDELRLVQRAVDRLPARAREAFTLHHVVGLSVREIAIRMMIAERTVVGHLNEGLQTLADILYGEVPEKRAGR
jgi:RNA polymerase sigma factor (sigma-70 family)